MINLLMIDRLIVTSEEEAVNPFHSEGTFVAVLCSLLSTTPLCIPWETPVGETVKDLLFLHFSNFYSIIIFKAVLKFCNEGRFYDES